MVKPCERKNVAAYLMESYQASITRACKVVNLPKSMFYYKHIKDDSAVMSKLQQLAEAKPREGQDKFYGRIRSEGIRWNYKRIRRVYKMMGLNQRRKIKKRVPARVKQPLVQPQGANQM